MLWPAYHSTDFEVHRNWLAITYSLPLRDWYFEATSQWTLDYPPFFAYFSWLLAQPAPLVDPLIVAVHEGLEHAATPAKYYMRATVVVTELVLAAAVWALSETGASGTSVVAEEGGKGKKASRQVEEEEEEERRGTLKVLAASILLHPGVIIIDHIHFQYNGFLFGALFWALWAAREVSYCSRVRRVMSTCLSRMVSSHSPCPATSQNKPLLSAFLFSTLLNLKHIYMYIAPAFFIYLLRSYVYPPGSTSAHLPAATERLITVGAFTLAPFALSLVPLLLAGFYHEAGPLGVLSQMLGRLFPFSRGLNHAYWAPNFWALWTASDRVLLQLLRRSPALVRLLPSALQRNFSDMSASGSFASASRGLIGNVDFAVLPTISPRTCFALTVCAMLPALAKLWRAPTYRSFLTALTLCAYASFLFGWHVHEKAILLVLLPFTWLAADDYLHFRSFTVLSVAGIFSLFPLLYQPAETPIKVVVTLLWLIIVLGYLSQKVFRPVPSNLGLLIHSAESLYLFGFPLVFLYCSVAHPLLFPGSPSAVVESAAAASAAALQEAALPTVAAAATSSIEAASILDFANATTAAEGLLSSASAIVAPAMETLASSATSVLSAVSSAVGAESLASLAASATTALAQAAESIAKRAPASAPSTGSSLDFLPLMLTSVYCAIGVLWIAIKLNVMYVLRDFRETGAAASVTSSRKKQQ